MRDQGAQAGGGIENQGEHEEAEPATREVGQAETTEAEKLAELYRTFEFKGWLAELLEGQDPAVDGDVAALQPEHAVDRDSYDNVLTGEQLDAWIEKLKNADLFAFDTETTSLN